MADETQPEVQSPDPAAPEAVQEPAATPADPAVQTVPAAVSEPEVTPDPTQAPAEQAGATATTSPEPSEQPTGETPKSAKPVVVNQFTKRSDDDALLGSWVDVIAGEYQGRKGAYVDDDSHDPETGYPSQVIVRTRDAENELITVNYADIRPSAYTGGR